MTGITDEAAQARVGCGARGERLLEPTQHVVDRAAEIARLGAGRRIRNAPTQVVVGDGDRGLATGGDDYLVKPFSLEELVARVEAVLRRSGLTQSDAILRCEDLELDDDAHRVMRAGKEISLSPTEFNLLRFLLANQGRVLSRAQILDHVWQYDFGGDGRIVETYIAYLRKKVEIGGPKLIQTVRGVGYTLRVG